MKSPALICTCTEWQSQWGHLKDCELWEDPDFTDQLSIWDCEAMKLVPTPEGWLPKSEDGSEFVSTSTGEVVSLFDMLLDSLNGHPHPDCALAGRETQHDPAECVGCITEILKEKEDASPSELKAEKGCVYNGDWCIYHSKWRSAHLGVSTQEEKKKGGAMMDLSEEEYSILLEQGADLHVPDESVPYKCSCPWTKVDDCEVCGVFFDLDDRCIPTSVRRLVEANMRDANRMYDCECEPQPKWRCRKCEVQRETTMDPWTYFDPEAYDLDWAEDFAWWRKALDGGGSSSSTFGKCRHYSYKLEMPDKTILYPSSQFTRTGKADEPPEPDVSVMLYSGWKPNKIALYVDWPDYGLPSVPWTELKWLINEMYKKAKKGQYVEFGCMGGHGRTGTLLGCMLVQKHNMTAENAIKWVHKNYCTQAIEGEQQEWFIDYYRSMIKGIEVPPQPVKKTNYGTSSGTCTIKSHYDLWLAGKECQKKSEKAKGCSWWLKDKEDFESNKVPGDGGYSMKDGGPSAPKPKASAPVQTSMYDNDGEWSNCLKEDHYPVWLNGKDCDKGPGGKPCYWWSLDEKEFNEGVLPSAVAVHSTD